MIDWKSVKRPHGKYSWQHPHSSRSSLQPAPQTQQPHFSFPAPITALYPRKDKAPVSCCVAVGRSPANTARHGHILVVRAVRSVHAHRSCAVTVSLSMSDLEKLHTVHVEYNDNDAQRWRVTQRCPADRYVFSHLLLQLPGPPHDLTNAVGSSPHPPRAASASVGSRPPVAAASVRRAATARRMCG